MAKQFLIGTDIGTSGTKSVLTDLKGNVISSSLIEHTIITKRALWAEQWPDVWVSAAKRTIKDVIVKSGIEVQEIAGICISGLYGGSGIPCDSEMRAVRPCIIWMDRRALLESKWVEENIDQSKLFSITGNGNDPYFGFTKILWIKNNEPENWGKIKLFLPPNDYVIYQLTGEIAIDYSSAGNIGGIFDMRRMHWSKGLMKELGIPLSYMPQRIVSASDVVGGLTIEAANELGLPVGTPVCAGGIDCIIATLSSGAIEPGQHVAVIGTSINWGMVHKNFPRNKNLVTMPYAKSPEKYLYTYGGASTAGALPRWFRDNFAQIEKVMETKGDADAYGALDSEAEKIPPGSEGLIILPYFMGERTPIWDIDARGTIFGLTLKHTKAHIYRAILESVAYSLRHIMEEAESDLKNVSECILVGGVTKSKLWKQIFADVTGVPIKCPKGYIEAPLGDAFLAGIGTGNISDYSEIKNWVEFDEKILPNMARTLVYSKYFKEYKNLYPSLAKNMKRLSNISKEDFIDK